MEGRASQHADGFFLASASLQSLGELRLGFGKSLRALGTSFAVTVGGTTVATLTDADLAEDTETVVPVEAWRLVASGALVPGDNQVRLRVEGGEALCEAAASAALEDAAWLEAATLVPAADDDGPYAVGGFTALVPLLSL